MSAGIDTRHALADCERIIERGLTTFVEVGQALARIRDERLYREAHATFEDYCRDRWGFSRQTGYDLMQTAQVAELVQDVGHVPSREAARALAPLRDEPQNLRDTWSAAVETHGPQPTATQVRDVVDRRDDHRVVCPRCGRITRTDRRHHCPALPLEGRNAQIARKNVQRIEHLIGTCQGLDRGLRDVPVELAASAVTDEALADWRECIDLGIKALREFRQRIPERGATEEVDA